MAGASGRHLRQHRGNAVEHALDVDVDHSIPLIDLNRGHQRQRHNAGIIDDHVDASPGLARRLGKGGDFCAIGYVQAACHCLPALCPDFACECVQPIGAARTEHDLCSGSTERPADGGANAARSPGNEHDFVEGHVFVSVWLILRTAMQAVATKMDLFHCCG